MGISVVGVDLSKSVFQLSVTDAKHHVFDRKRLSRAQFHRFLARTEPASLVMEACGTSHYWGARLNRWAMRSSYCMPYMSKPTCGGRRQMPPMRMH
jgi:hypothetical protein